METIIFIIFLLIIAAGVYIWLKVRANKISEKQIALDVAKSKLDDPNFKSVILNKDQNKFLALTKDDQIATSDFESGEKTYPASLEAISLTNGSSINLYQVGLTFDAATNEDAQKFYEKLVKSGAKELIRITSYIKVNPKDVQTLNLASDYMRIFHIRSEETESINDPIYIIGESYDKRWLTDIKIERKYQVKQDENHRINCAILLLTIQDTNNKLHRIKVSADQATYEDLKQHFLASNAFVRDNKQTTNTSDDKKHQLENLKDLLDQGIITSEEFEVKKKNILGL